MLPSWFRSLRSACPRPRGMRSRRTSQPRPPCVLLLVVLEDRTVPSTLTVRNNADSGAGSLRAAIAAAESGDTMVFDPSLMHETITLTSGPLAISSNLTIDGPGASLLAISGNQASQLFTLDGNAQVTLAHLTLMGGQSAQGGAIFLGGTAALTLDSDILSNNQAVDDAHGNALGGAIYTSAGTSLTVDHSVFVNNQAEGTVASFGGAIANAGSLAIQGGAFTGNTALGGAASRGGAIGNRDGATATIQGSTFTNNQALGIGDGFAAGGAICNEDGSVFPPAGAGVTCTLSRCTFMDNTAQGGSTTADGGYGGAIENEPHADLTVLDCLFTGNQANSGGGVVAGGGAIDDSVGATVNIAGSQFINNSALGTGVGARAVGGAVDNYQTMTIANSLFTGNRAMAGPMADGVTSFGLAEGGAIFTGHGLGSGVTVILTLSNSTIAGNEAIGGSGGSTLVYPRIDAAYGGGIDNLGGGTLNVSGCTITGNAAIGGASASGRGGQALGGGIDNQLATLFVVSSTISTNLSQGGAGASGAAGGIAAGGGMSNDRGSLAVLTNSTIGLNECLGGAGGAGANGGAAVGAGLANAVYAFAWGIPDYSSLTLSNCRIVSNLAQGGRAGSSAVGGDGLGSGVFAASGTIVLDAVLVSANQSQGGGRGQGDAPGNGRAGGVYIDPSATVTANTETLIVGNQASGGNADIWGTITLVP